VLQFKEKYQIEITRNKFAALKDSVFVEDIKRVWENIKADIKTSVK
jgi:hypothetical protein